MLDRLMSTRKAGFRLAFVVLAFPLVWLAWLGLMMAAGVADLLQPQGRR